MSPRKGPFIKDSDDDDNEQLKNKKKKKKKVKKSSYTDELAESISDFIKIDTKPEEEKKQDTN